MYTKEGRWKGRYLREAYPRLVQGAHARRGDGFGCLPRFRCPASATAVDSNSVFWVSRPEADGQHPFRDNNGSMALVMPARNQRSMDWSSDGQMTAFQSVRTATGDGARICPRGVF